MSRPRADEPANATASQDPLADFAIELLELQQRLHAFDALYNEEVGGLTRDLTQLKADFLRHCQAQVTRDSGAARNRRPLRGARTSPSTSPAAPTPRAPARRAPPAPTRKEDANDQASAS